MGQKFEQGRVAALHAVSSKDVLDRILPHLPKIGVTRVADLTGLDAIGIPVCAAHRPNARSLAITQGKGATLEDAKTSAIMEAVELSCAETPVIPLRLATANELSLGGEIIPLERLPLLEGMPIPRDRTALWAEGKPVGRGRPVWVPYEVIHMNYTLPLPPRLGCFLMSSTGLAAGMSVDAAVAQALAEAIERDAITLWRHQPSGPSERRVDLDTVDDPACLDLLARFDRAGVACAIWDVTSDLEIPVFFVTIVDRVDDARRGLHAASGSGAHPDRGSALSRALTEAAQSRLTLISGGRDDRSRASYRKMRGATALQAQRAEIVDGSALRRFSDICTHPVLGVDQALSCMLAALSRAGLGVPVVVDLSIADIPASVVRVLVPGLEGTSDAPGYKPGARALALRAYQ